jgi:predicted permease
MISLLLLEKIAQLFLGLVFGFILVKTKILHTDDSRVLSAVILYAATPCVIISTFQMEISTDLVQGMLLCLGGAAVAHLVFWLLSILFKRPFRLSNVERANTIYTNSGDLIIPIVGALFGKEWILFTVMYSIIEIPLFWSHCRILVSGKADITLKKVLLNVNILSIIIGVLLFSFQITLPDKLLAAMDPIGNLMGPLGMTIAGMLIGGMDLKKVLSYRGIWKVAFLRLLVFPLIMLAILKLSGASAWVANGETILMISFLAMAAPCAATVTQQSLLFGQEGQYSGAIYTITTLLCIITIPLMIALYQL